MGVGEASRRGVEREKGARLPPHAGKCNKRNEERRGEGGRDEERRGEGGRETRRSTRAGSGVRPTPSSEPVGRLVGAIG
jgi:hypothetical protein